MNKTAAGDSLDYPKFTKLLTVLGWGLLLLSAYSNTHMGLCIAVILIGTMPLTLTIAIRSESLSYAKDFRRSWVDKVMENANNILLVGGVVAVVYGFKTENILFTLWLGVIYIITVSLAMWLAWKIVRRKSTV